jgi:hypothetical protein
MRWDFRSIDSRTVRRTNKVQLEEWRQDYGEDSDFFRVRVAGLFPRADVDSFIGFAMAKAAVVRELPELNHEDMILGVDVARFGDDASVIYPRKGRDARTYVPEVYYKLDTVALAMRVRNAIMRYTPTMVFVDETGLGAGVVDTLRSMRLGTLIIGVNFSAQADGFADEKYANKRAEIWGMMREWLKDGCILDKIPGLETSLVDELTGPNYAFNGRDEIQLESKKDMRRRRVKSPDASDALACTFAMPLMPRPLSLGRVSDDEWERGERERMDYDPLEVI